MKLRKFLVFVIALLLAVSFMEGATKPVKKRKRPKKPKANTTELDPLRMIKTFRDATTKVGPNVLIAIDLSPRMLYDANGVYYDPKTWDKQKDAASQSAANELGVPLAARYYKRAYTNLKRRKIGEPSENYTADSIQVVPETSVDEYSTFYFLSRLGMARDGLAQAVEENLWNVRFGLLRMRQGDDANWPNAGNKTPLTVEGASQKNLLGDNQNKSWKVTFPTTKNRNIDAKAQASDLLVKANDNDSSAKTLQMLESDPDSDKGLKPFGLDDDSFSDSPVTNLLVDAKAEVERLMDVDDSKFRPCRNTAVILVVGGGDGSGRDPSKEAAKFKSITVKGTTRAVPIYVIALGPTGNVNQLKDVASESGGEYFEVSNANEVAWIGNYVVQAAHRMAPDFDAGLFSEFQTVHPVVGTVNLANAKDINGKTLPYTSARRGGSSLTQENNLLLTTGFTLPGFEASLRAFRAYRPEPDKSAPSGFKYVNDGTPLWVAHIPGASYVGNATGDGKGGDGGKGDKDGKKKAGSGKSGAGMMANGYEPGNPDKRNIFTYLPGTGMVAFTSANASTLRPFLQQETDADAQAVIEFVRAQQIGATISSVPAVMNPPSMIPPDAEYAKFANERKSRRTIIFVGGNNGMLHAIDARTGVEVWAFIPFNHLPKLQTLVDGQGVVYFDYFVDGSPKLADVKVGGVWRTYLMVGEGSGGTFYQSLDVSDAGLGVAPDSDSEGTLLAAFKSTTAITFKWSFPSYSKFDHTISTLDAPYGDVGATASSVEKSVGETWSTPAIGQLGDANGKWAAMMGSGYLAAAIEALAHRGGARAGTTFYVLNMADGSVLSSYDVGDDAGKNNLKNSLSADPAAVGPTPYLDRAFVGDTEGIMWRFLVNSAGILTPAVKIYDAKKEHPIFTSASVSAAGGNQYHVFFSTGIDTLPHIKKIEKFVLVGLLDTGTTTCSGSAKVSGTAMNGACALFEVPLEKADGKGGDERSTSAPVVAGSAVYWTTTTDFPKEPCLPTEVSLFAMSLGGGAAFDTNNDKKVDSKDSILLNQSLGRATGLFVADQHLYYGSDNTVSIFGDPEDFNNGVGLTAAKMLSWREIR